MFYVGTRKHGEKVFDVSLDAHPMGWANDIADILRTFGQFEEVRVFPQGPVDELLKSGRATQVNHHSTR